MIPEDDGCQHGRRIVRVATPVLNDQVFQPFLHHDCIHNQLVSIHNRVCGLVPEPNAAGLASLRKAANHMINRLPTTIPEDYYVMPMRYGGSKRTRYLQATDEVMHFGFDRKDASVKMFVKSEKLQPDDAKPNPDPRAIQFRNAKYCVEISRFLKPIEEHLYHFDGASKGVPRTRNVAKGLNQVERAQAMRQKLAHFTNPVVVELDASRFDQHVSKALLQIEHFVYYSKCPDPFFEWLCSMQLMNKCTSSRGIKYSTKGKRMSGDMNTALGNCVLMLLMLIAMMEWCSKWDCFDDGDDVELIIEKRDLPRVMREVHTKFLSYGMEVKVENVAHSLFDINFCQSKVIEFAPGEFKFTRNPWKVISCALAGVKYYNQDGARAKLLHTIGLCELILNLGVPVLQEFALAVLRNCGTDETLNLPPDGSLMSRVRRELRALGLKQIERVEPQPIHEVARHTFQLAFDVSPHRQVQMEDYLRSWRFELSGVVLLPDEWEVPTWDFSPADTPELYTP